MSQNNQNYYSAINTKLVQQNQNSSIMDQTLEDTLEQNMRLEKYYKDRQNQQRKHLDKMREEINVKTRLAQINNQEFGVHSFNAVLLTYFLALVVFISALVVLVLIGIISYQTALVISIISIVLYGAYMIYLLYFNASFLGQRRASQFAREYDNDAMRQVAQTRLRNTPFNCPSECQSFSS